jgi:hypothetical protein
MAFLKPAKGASVRFPRTLTLVPEDGVEVALDGADVAYWSRRINDGSVTIVETPVIPVQTAVESVRTKGGR